MVQRLVDWAVQALVFLVDAAILLFVWGLGFVLGVIWHANLSRRYRDED